MICSCCGEDKAEIKVGQHIAYIRGIQVPFVENYIKCRGCGSEFSNVSCGESIHTLRALQKLGDRIEFLENSLYHLVKNLGEVKNDL